MSVMRLELNGYKKYDIENTKFVVYLLINKFPTKCKLRIKFVQIYSLKQRQKKKTKNLQACSEFG